MQVIRWVTSFSFGCWNEESDIMDAVKFEKRAHIVCAEIRRYLDPVKYFGEDLSGVGLRVGLVVDMEKSNISRVWAGDAQTDESFKSAKFRVKSEFCGKLKDFSKLYEINQALYSHEWMECVVKDPVYKAFFVEQAVDEEWIQLLLSHWNLPVITFASNRTEEEWL